MCTHNIYLQQSQKKILSFSQGLVAKGSFPVVFWGFCPLSPSLPPDLSCFYLDLPSFLLLTSSPFPPEWKEQAPQSKRLAALFSPGQWA